MLGGFLAFKFGGEKYVPAVGAVENVFSYSFIKNCIFMTLLLLNAFSLIGFPLSSMLIFFAGYMQAVSAFYIFISNMPFSFKFLLRVIPHSALSLYITMFMGVHVLNYSKQFFGAFTMGRSKAFLGQETLRLIIHYFYSLFIIACIAFYEANFL